MFRKRVASRPYDLPTAVDLLAEGSTAQRFPRCVSMRNVLGHERAVWI